MFPDSIPQSTNLQPMTMEPQPPIDTAIKTEETATKKTRNYAEWYGHVNKVKAEHPELSHKEAVKTAKSSYTKAPKKKRDKSGYKPNAWMQHIAEWTKNNPDWRKKFTYKDVLKMSKLTYKK